MVAVALVHSTALMMERLPEKPPAWLTRGERTFAYPYKELFPTCLSGRAVGLTTW